MQRKFISIAVVGTMVLFLGWFIWQQRNAPDTVRKKITTTAATVSQKISSPGSANADFVTVPISKGTTALDVLKKAGTVKTKGEGENAFVIKIGDYEASDAKREFWAFYVNGKQAPVGAGSYKVQPNDKIEWKIETY